MQSLKGENDHHLAEAANCNFSVRQRCHSTSHWYKSFKNVHKLSSFGFTSFLPNLRKYREIRDLFTFYNVTYINFTKKITFPYSDRFWPRKMEIVYNQIYEQIFWIYASVHLLCVFHPWFFSQDIKYHQWSSSREEEVTILAVLHTKL